MAAWTYKWDGLSLGSRMKLLAVIPDAEVLGEKTGRMTFQQLPIWIQEELQQMGYGKKPAKDRAARLHRALDAVLDRAEARDAEKFNEAAHPRRNDGKFGNGASPSLPIAPQNRPIGPNDHSRPGPRPGSGKKSRPLTKLEQNEAVKNLSRLLGDSFDRAGAARDGGTFKKGDHVTTDVTPQTGVVLSVEGTGDMAKVLVQFGKPDKYDVSDVRKLYAYLLRRA